MTVLDPGFWGSLGSIVLIDLLLAGDNAVVIAMAVRPLPQRQRRRGIVLGAGAAVLVRVVLTFFVAQLLAMPFVKLAGGVLVLWIAVKLFAVEEAVEEGERRDAASAWDAVKLIVVADVTMSLDNMLAVGGASGGNPVLLGLGLAVSIPFVVFTSDLLSRLMDRFPAVLYLGAAILGKVGAEMILTDPFTAGRLHPTPGAVHAAEAAMAIAIAAGGKLWERRARRPRARPAASPDAGRQ
ncbi:MAG TPA: TerC family protein [Anaeromyxobacteraceae bacterium]|nr:TerC family protein [Anaeromyxobacteraceae bacterium]